MSEGPVRSLRVSLGLFTVLPVAGPANVDQRDAVRAVLWLPLVGLLLGGIGAVVLLVVDVVTEGTAGRLLGALLAIGSLAALTGALHLDGLADTADGLGSRRSPVDALAIMRRSDIGPMGVVALVFVVGIQVAALATAAPAEAALAVSSAAVVGRVAVVLAAGAPAARDGGFGTLVATGVGRTWRLGWVATVLVLAAAPALSGSADLAVRLVVATGIGLVAGAALCNRIVRRLGGMTGDVYGAVIETVTVVVLLVLALTG